MYVPEDKDQALVETPYGKGLVLRSRQDASGGKIIMREIELTDWAKAKPEVGVKPQRPTTLYSPTTFPSIRPGMGSEVSTQFGRGKITALREDGTVVVRISSWRLAGRSIVTCYLSPSSSVQVMRPKKIYEMSVHEKIEHAQELKADASTMFAEKKYEEALQVYARAVDAVRYVQHKKDSSNEVRADLLVVMITCCNNAATCCLQLRDWDRALKFAKNALVLVDALEEKKGSSKIQRILNADGVTDSQLFGTWKVKSLLVIGRSSAEKHDTEEAISILKQALEIIPQYKRSGDAMFPQLQGQEKQVRKLFVACKERLKAEKKKEKQRAMAMFAATDEKKDAEKAAVQDRPETSDSEDKGKQGNVTLSTNANASIITKANTDAAGPSSTTSEETDCNDSSLAPHDPQKKRVSFADGSTPGSVDDDAEPSFLDQHKEALLVVAGIVLGSVIVNLAFRRGR